VSGNLGLYGYLWELVNGSLLSQEQSIQVDRATNSQPVSTVPNGYSGESPGAAMIEVTVESAVPQVTGFEFDAGASLGGLIPVQLYTLGPGGKTLKGECFIISDSIRHSVNNPMQYTFRARGPLAFWQ
jgi:hypothetical protein